MTRKEMEAVLAGAGVVGAGGAGFPTHRKLAEGIDTVLVNAVECEPLLHTDACLLRHFLQEVVAGAESFAASMGASRVVLGIKQHNAGPLGLAQGQKLGEMAEVAVVPDVYPMGDEIILIYQALHRLVQPGALPSSVGVVVVNAETALNIDAAVQRGEAVTHSWLTIGGAVETPCVVKVPVGTPVSALFKAKNITVPAGHVVLDGGPAMGRVINPALALVEKTTKGLLVLPELCAAVTNKTADTARLVKRTPSACCQCTFCTDMCPRQLLGWPLQPHKTLRSAGYRQVGKVEDVTSASLCSGCGVCSFVACCQGCAPATVMALVKSGLAQNGLRYSGKGKQPDAMREYRLVPSARFAALLGVARFEKDAPWDEEFVLHTAAERG